MPHDDHLFIEETLHAKNRKASKQERRRLTLKDRSKYKKTDIEKIKPFEEMEGKQGRVLQVSPEGVLCEIEGNHHLCHLKGNLKKEKRMTKSILAIGDLVKVQEENGVLQIIQILPRKTILSRADNLSRKKEQVIAANVDQVLITASILEPHLKNTLIDRYLIAAHRGNLDPVILITKIDLIDQAEEPLASYAKEELEIIQSIAHSLEIPIILLSIKTGQGLDQLQKILENKTSVFSGQSGVGKSSLMNLVTKATQETAPIVSRTQKGSHTTSYALLLPLKEGYGYCVDTPGIRSFGLWDIKEEDIHAYFKEIDEASKLCKFPDCRHQSEPDCHVKQQCEKGLINPWRFESYLVLMEQINQQHRRR